MIGNGFYCSTMIDALDVKLWIQFHIQSVGKIHIHNNKIDYRTIFNNIRFFSLQIFPFLLFMSVHEHLQMIYLWFFFHWCMHIDNNHLTNMPDVTFSFRFVSFRFFCWHQLIVIFYRVWCRYQIHILKWAQYCVCFFYLRRTKRRVFSLLYDWIVIQSVSVVQSIIIFLFTFSFVFCFRLRHSFVFSWICMMSNQHLSSSLAHRPISGFHFLFGYISTKDIWFPINVYILIHINPEE